MRHGSKIRLAMLTSALRHAEAVEKLVNQLVDHTDDDGTLAAVVSDAHFTKVGLDDLIRAEEEEQEEKLTARLRTRWSAMT